MRKQLYKKGFEVQKWKIIDRTPVNKNHTIFTLASSEYENEKGIFREFIKIRDNVLTNLIKNVENINDVKKRSLHRWCFDKKDVYGIICLVIKGE